MFDSNRRGMLAMYTIIAIALFILLISSALPAILMTFLLLAYFSLVILTSRSISLEGMRRTGRRLMTRAPQISRAAEAAVARSPDNNGILKSPYTLQDIGLIIDERRRGGMVLRHARFMSMDDESMRPYAVVHIPIEGYAQAVMVRYQLTDDNQQPQFIYEQETVLHPGENLLIPDYRLRLKGNDRLENPGKWRYSLSIDGHRLAIHEFNLLAAMADRLRQSPDGEVNANLQRMVVDVDESLPLSLEELLSQHSRA